MNTYQWVKRIGIVLVIIAGVGYLWWQMSYQQQSIRLHGNSYHATVLKEKDELYRGLSGKKSLPEGEAMLFVFPQDSKWGIWMKDMNFPIDIVWLDSNANVVYLVKNAQPSSYPKTTFKPDKNASYVIELPSGTIDRTGIQVGDPAGLPSGI